MISWPLQAMLAAATLPLTSFVGTSGGVTTSSLSLLEELEDIEILISLYAGFGGRGDLIESSCDDALDALTSNDNIVFCAASRVNLGIPSNGIKNWDPCGFSWECKTCKCISFVCWS